MKIFKNLFLAFIAVVSLTMISCQGDAKDAKDKAHESLANPPAGDQGISTNPSGVNPDEQVPSGPTTSIAFEETDFDFGAVNDGEKVKHTYKFKNTGNEPLIIASAKGSCGCTVPKWPSDPIAPGQTGVIDVEFDSKGKPGRQTKRVTVTANTVPAQSFLNITGNVNKDPNAPATPASPPVAPPKKISL